MELSSAGQKKNLLGAKTRELIALAGAVTLRCDDRITVHAEAAIKHGAGKDEVAEAPVCSTSVMGAFKKYPRAVSSQA